MSDRETLERYIHSQGGVSDLPPKVVDAIRAVLKALVEQKKATAESDRASLAYAQENQKLIAANERHRAHVEALVSQVNEQCDAASEAEKEVEQLRAIKRSDTEMIEECRKELAELANNRDGLEHDWSERGARIDAALAYLGDVCACDTGPCDFCVIRKALKGEAVIENVVALLP